jgi:hypothetical protein
LQLRLLLIPSWKRWSKTRITMMRVFLKTEQKGKIDEVLQIASGVQSFIYSWTFSMLRINVFGEVAMALFPSFRIVSPLLDHNATL